MVKLNDLRAAMQAQFIWDRSGQKIMQLNEEMEGSKDLARMIFCGIADMYGFDSASVMTFIEMEHEGYRNKLQQFKLSWREANKRVTDGTIYLYEDPIRKFYVKTCMTLNSIKFKEGGNPFLKFKDFMNNE